MSLIRRFFLITALLAGQLCLAQSEQSDTAPTEDPQSEPRKQYLVELIAFQYQGPDSSAGEEFEQLVVENYLPLTRFNIEEYRRVREVVTYTELVHLSAALERLRSSPQYSVLTSTAWIQPLLGQNDAVDVPLGADGSRAATDPSSPGTPVSTRISGSVRIYGDYLLFAKLDIKAALPRRTRDEAGRGQSSGGSFTRRTIAPQRQFEVFRISERRRIKLEEVHYFDHPYIGAILSVTRYE